MSRLDGHNFTEVKAMIDRSCDPNYSGTGTWILDGGLSLMNGDVSATNSILTGLGFNTVVDYVGNNWITQNATPVMGYTSGGFNIGMPTLYIHDTLDFDYLNGAAFNTYESFNAWAMDTSLISVLGLIHGLVSEWVLRRSDDNQAGTVGAGHTFEPFVAGLSEDRKFFPAYAMGYNIVDAVYQGMKYLGWQNCVVGDPLTAIAWGKQTLTQNLTWSGRNLVTGEITIPVPYTTLTIDDDAYIELRHEGFIPCTPAYGRLIVGQNVTFETDSWDRALFLSYDSENPRLVWAEHPSFPAISYNVYRKFDGGNWSLIANVMDNEYTDEEVYFTCYECPTNATVNYRVTALSQLQESDSSNEVSAEVLAHVGKESEDNQTKEKVYTYSLNQNYPNPFNPSTTISYSIKEDGKVQLKVYDILGNEVVELVNERESAGSYVVTFNASNLPSGIYFYTLTSGNYQQTKKLILLK